MILTIIVFVIILGLLIFIHELGHFVTARKMNVRVEEFGFGFPPRAFGIYKSKDGKWKKVFGNKELEKDQNTVYSLNWLPIGGFVKIFGEEGEGEKDPNSFMSKPVWVRSLILSAGVFMNFVLAMVLLTIGFKIGLPQAVEEGDTARDLKIQIAQVSKDSPAESSGLAIGDQIVSIGGKEFIEIEDVQEKIKSESGKEVNFKIRRGNEDLNIKATPRENPPEGEGALGVALAKTGIVSYPLFQSIWMGITTTFTIIVAILLAFYDIIHNLIVQKPISAEFAGPVGIAVLTGQVTRMGFVYILQFAAVLSINLGILNILPFPALDGGRILFLLIEKIRGKKVSQKIENTIHMAGFFLLILLLVVVTFKDIFKFSDIFTGLWDRIIN
ncbi:MAG: RIP metalloprotease RseP [Parcubacteria group bacterium]|nr:RIP metalloprotease RseP [Parcubacteria group bacterium]